MGMGKEMQPRRRCLKLVEDPTWRWRLKNQNLEGRNDLQFPRITVTKLT